jgi:hypothetical protein
MGGRQGGTQQGGEPSGGGYNNGGGNMGGGNNNNPQGSGDKFQPNNNYSVDFEDDIPF